VVRGYLNATAVNRSILKAGCNAGVLVACATFFGLGCTFPVGSEAGTAAVRFYAITDTSQGDDGKLLTTMSLTDTFGGYDLDTMTVGGSRLRDSLNLTDPFWQKVLLSGLDYSWKKDAQESNRFNVQGRRSFLRSERAALDTVATFNQLRDSLIHMHHRSKAPAYLVDAWLPMSDGIKPTGDLEKASRIYSVLHRNADNMVIYRNKVEIITHFYETDSPARHRTWFVHDLVIRDLPMPCKHER